MNYAMLSVIYGATTLLRICFKIAIIVFVQAVVRRHRPDAYKPLLQWAILSVVASVFMWAFNFIGPLLSRADGYPDAMMMERFVNAGIGIFLELGLTFLLARGLVHLALPPKPVVVETDVPYR
jgi:hypothetical protein